MAGVGPVHRSRKGGWQLIGCEDRKRKRDRHQPPFSGSSKLATHRLQALIELREKIPHTACAGWLNVFRWHRHASLSPSLVHRSRLSLAWASTHLSHPARRHGRKLLSAPSFRARGVQSRTTGDTPEQRNQSKKGIMTRTAGLEPRRWPTLRLQQHRITSLCRVGTGSGT